jgi:ATP-dependent Zn protease
MPKIYLAGVMRKVADPFCIAGAIFPAYADWLYGLKKSDDFYYHEAGHALVHHVIAGAVTKPVSLTMRPAFAEAIKGTLARFSLRQEGPDNTASHKAMIVVDMAGLAGVKILRGTSYVPRGCHSDYKDAIERLSEMWRVSGEDFNADDARACLMKAEYRAYQILQKYEGSLHALAAALKQRQTLQAPDIEAAVGFPFGAKSEPSF